MGPAGYAKPMACSSCGASIFYAKTRASGGRTWMPLDWKPVEGGNVALDADDLAIVDPPAELPGDRYVSHFATCRFAAQHRKPKGDKPDKGDGGHP